MSLLKDAFEWIKNHGENYVHEIDGQQYTDRPIHPVQEPELPLANALTVHTLSAVVDYIKRQLDTDKDLIIHVKDEETVYLMDALNKDMRRNVYLKANAIVPSITFDRYMDVETFNVELQSKFVQTELRDIMLKVVGNIQDENVQKTSDDGVSQTVTAKVGVASVAQVAVPNPVELAPYRTFVEVEQPESKFIFRMKSGPMAALFEADGGKWRNDAIQNIADYFRHELEDEVESGKITVVA